MEHPSGSRAGERDRGSGTGRLVLHVDDSPAFAHLTATMLEDLDEDLTVVSEPTAAAGLSTLAERPVDCVVSDYQMPEMDGVAFLEAVRNDHPDLPFVLFTGQGSEAVASRAISAGVTDYLQKSDGLEVFEVLARQIENAIERRRAVERFETFMESAPDSIVVVDGDGTIEEVNQQTETLFGHDRAALLGEPVEVLLPHRFRDEHVVHREQYVSDPETRPMGADLQLYGLHADGTEFPVDVAISPVYVGGQLEVIAAVRDMSTRTWREAQLREREAVLDRQTARLETAISAVGPEFNALLDATREQLALARETNGDDHLEAAERRLDRMEGLFEDLVGIASDGWTDADLEPVPLATVASRAWHTVEPPGASLAVETDDELLADPDAVERLLVNLFLGAVDRSGPDVTVRVVSVDGGFAVEDDGPGVPPTVRTELRERGDRTRAGRADFGLTTVERIAATHEWETTLLAGEEGGFRVEVTGVERP